MKKVHTRMKRKHRLSTHKSAYGFFHAGAEEHRPRTFKTEGAARAWALSNGLKEGKYSLKRVKKNKRFQLK